MGRDVAVTLRIAPELRQRVQQIADEHGVSQSAVWKILIARHVRPALSRPLFDVPRTEGREDPDLHVP